MIEKRKRNRLGLAALVGASFLVGPAAHATLVGDSVTCDISSSAAAWVCTPPSAVVDAGVEFDLVLTGTPVAFEVDVGASSITMTSVGGALFAGANELLTIGDLDWVDGPGRVVGIANFFTSGTSGIELADIGFSEDSVSIFFDGGAGLNEGSVISFDLVVEHEAPVPEPAAAVCFAVSLAVLGVARRRAA